MVNGLPFRLAVAAMALALVAGCERPSDLAEPPVDLGPFDLGLNIVVADNAQKVPISRNATPDEWETSLSRAVENRFGRYDGDRFYNIGISVDGYALAPPGIPVVVAPKSVLVITANVWDDERSQKLNGAGTRFTIFESLSGEQVIGTGITRTKQEQMDALAYNAAKVIENWFLENPQWFGQDIPVPDPMTDTPAAAATTAGAVTAAPAEGVIATPVPAILPARTATPPAAIAPVTAPPVTTAVGADFPALPPGAIYPETP